MTPEPVHRTWIHSARFIPTRFVRPLQQFTQIEASSGIVLLVAAVLALAVANSPWSDVYFNFLEIDVVFALGPLSVEGDLLHLINDGLMAIFFFVVGLEIKRELVTGELQTLKTASLPALAALGGMVVPALIYLAIAGGVAPNGWGIPMATDIAFSVGVLALLGRRVPATAKLFLLALAIADDIGAIAVIAVFYAGDLHLGWLAVTIAGLGIVALGSRAGIRWTGFYVAMGGVVWLMMLQSGVHATLAGVALGFLTPARPMYDAEEFDRKSRSILDTYPVETGREQADYEALQLAQIAKESVSPLSRLESSLHLWSSYAVVPLFAFANAGVSFAGIQIAEVVTSPVAMGVGVGLLLGKIVGISAASLAAVRLGWATMPAGLTRRHLFGLSILAGIGFTVALFVAGLAFPAGELINHAKVGIFAGSLVAGITGYLFLSRSKDVVQ